MKTRECFYKVSDPVLYVSPSLMIFLAAMADDRWMGSMKILAASEPEIVENLDSDNMEKLGEKETY